MSAPPRAILIAIVTASLVLPVTARADGDPASDYLPTFNVFLPYDQPPPSANNPLQRAVDAVYAKHLRIKVAVIAKPADLGAIPSLFGKPAAYAHFLGQELQSFYIGPLLIVMPNGYGIYDGGRSTAAEEKVLARRPKGGTTLAALATDATGAVDALLAAHALASKDVLAPIVEPGANTRTMLHFSVLEDSGYASVQLTVRAHGKIVVTRKLPLRRVDAAKIYGVPWRVPAGLQPPASLCVTARDAAGNRSSKVCAPIALGG